MDIYDILEKLDIKYDEIVHKNVYTIKEVDDLKERIDGVGVKNIFLTNKRGGYFLVLIKDNKRLDIKMLESIFNTGHLSFGSDIELKDILGVESGSVSVFNIINDKLNRVNIFIDKELVSKRILFHPNINTRTISINYNDVIRIIDYLNHDYKLF